MSKYHHHHYHDCNYVEIILANYMGCEVTRTMVAYPLPEKIDYNGKTYKAYSSVAPGCQCPVYRDDCAPPYPPVYDCEPKPCPVPVCEYEQTIQCILDRIHITDKEWDLLQKYVLWKANVGSK